MEVIRSGLKEINLWDRFPQLSPVDLSDQLLSSIHDQEYLDILKQTSSLEKMLDPDTYTTRESWQLALNAAGGAAAIAESVWDRKSNCGFALTRPPGHHATASRGMGFCLLNNVAIAAEYILKEKGASRISILDLDLHHGNGTQDIFWNRPDVSYISLHQSPFYPGTGSLSEVGGGEGEGYTLNLPVPIRTGDRGFRSLVKEVVFPFLNEKKPEMLLISFGFDTHWRDPLGSLLLSASGIRQIFDDLRDWADNNCNGRLAVFLEGGYDLEAGRACGQAVVSSLVDQDWQDPLGSANLEEGEGWMQILSEAKTIWDLNER
ncbi:MAG: histone deacetylase [Anaerolineales bacterium]|nr:histone deacetylase [Anaerolineales bacterium]